MAEAQDDAGLDKVEPIKTEDLHPLLVAHEAALKAWAAALTSEGGLVGYQRFRSPHKADPTVVRLSLRVRDTKRAWKAAGLPLYSFSRPAADVPTNP